MDQVKLKSVVENRNKSDLVLLVQKYEYCRFCSWWWCLSRTLAQLGVNARSTGKGVLIPYELTQPLTYTWTHPIKMTRIYRLFRQHMGAG